MHEEKRPIEQQGADVLLRVRVQPKASRNAVRIEPGGVVRVSLTAPPVDGAANKALVSFLAKALGLPKRKVAVEHGAHSREKTVRLHGIESESVRARLEALGAP